MCLVVYLFVLLLLFYSLSNLCFCSCLNGSLCVCLNASFNAQFVVAWFDRVVVCLFLFVGDVLPSVCAFVAAVLLCWGLFLLLIC